MIRQDGLDVAIQEAGLTKADLARRLGVSVNTVQKWRRSAPQYVMAYLDVVTELNWVIDNLRKPET